MDRTLIHPKKGNKRRRARNWKAWLLLSPDGSKCRFCPHTAEDHLTSSGQPHFYRPATNKERQDPQEKLFRHKLPDGDTVTVKRIVVSNHAEIIATFCTACAKDKDTAQVLCYTRTLAKGEVIGLTGHSGNSQVEKTTTGDTGPLPSTPNPHNMTDSGTPTRRDRPRSKP